MDRRFESIMGFRPGLGDRKQLRLVWLCSLMVVWSGVARLAVAQTGTTLPVYTVTETGATATQGAMLSDLLGLPLGLVERTNGLVTFIDPTNHLAVPSVPVTDPLIVSNLLALTRNLYPDIPIRFQAIDFNALANLQVMDGGAAMSVFSNALSAAGLIPQFGTPVVSHTRFIAYYTNSSGVLISNNNYLDTVVNYQFVLPGGYPLVGPGAKVQAAFGPGGRITRLMYSCRQLVPGTQVQIISAADAATRAAALFPPTAQVNLQLVYWAPPLVSWRNPGSASTVMTLLPFYSCSGSMTVTNPDTGQTTPVTLKTRLMRATDNIDFVPSVNLSAQGTTQVVASVSVIGGRGPYEFLWTGSDSGVSSNTGPSVSYTATRRVAPPVLSFAPSAGGGVTLTWPYPSPGFLLELSSDLAYPSWTPFTGQVITINALNVATVGPQPGRTFFRLTLNTQTTAVTDTVGVTVVDANGVSASGSATIPVQIIHDRAPYSGPPKVCYGTESPNEPSFAVDRIGWQKGMALPGGGFESFCWNGDGAWPGDFIEPNPPGVYVSTPWVYGDADYSGINTASIVLNNTDGAPDYFCSSVPGATSDQYNTAGLARPANPGWTVQVNVINNKNTSNSKYLRIDYRYSWGPLGPNDFLYWLAMDCCNALDENGPGGTSPNRWGPAFSGLHVLTGFNSGEAVADGSFEYAFARYMLAPPYIPPQPVTGAWFIAGFFAGYDDHGYPAAMGPIGPAAVSDYWDCYWGKGSVNPTIPPSQVTGWWYMTHP
jgi:hypothetical protein